ncbi:MAG: ATP-binding protein [Caldisericia bacterium]|nr:ATP-binding protein [Caldisericia bacterium]
MTSNELIKQLLLSYNKSDKDAFISAAREYIEREKRMKHTQVVKELEMALFNTSENRTSFSERRFKNEMPIPRDSEKGFPLLEIKHFTDSYENLIVDSTVKAQIDQIIREFKDADILATYNLSFKKKILLCGKPGTGKTYTAQIISSLLAIPLVYIRFDSIISSYLGETASNLRKVFDYIEQGTWIVLFDEFDIIGKNRDDIHEHGEIKRVVNNFLQMMDNYNGNSILFAATNHQYMLDSAIWRRFDDIVYYDIPDNETRIKLFDRFLRQLKRDENISLESLAKKAKGLSPSDIKMITIEAIKISIIESRNKITERDLQIALTKFLNREKLRKGSNLSE